MMFDRRLAPEGSSSPPMSGLGTSVRESTVADTDGKSSVSSLAQKVCSFISFN